MTEVLICVGSGGVGKTTVAASLGVLAAMEGKKVLVLTIDPAKRLATTLGIEKTTDVTRVPHQNFKGELFASIIDHKKTFDDFVLRAAKKTESAKNILNNSLYKQLSTNLSGSQEFTALEKLYTCFESNEYDLIVLDTPPTKHAIDFLSAPQKLSALFNENVTKWFRDPQTKKTGLIGTILQTGTRQVLKILESLTGSTFIRELADFFKNIEQWQEQLQERTTAVQRMLVSERTQFCLVTSFDNAKLKEAEFFAREIRKGGYHLKTLVLNRAFPSWLHLEAEPQKSGESLEILRLYSQLKAYYSHREELYQAFEKRWAQQVRIFRIPDMTRDISDLPSLEAMTHLLSQGEKK